MKGQISSVKGSLLPQFSKYALEIVILIFREVEIRFSTSTSPHLIWSSSSGHTLFPMPKSGFPSIGHPFDLEI